MSFCQRLVPAVIFLPQPTAALALNYAPQPELDHAMTHDVAAKAMADLELLGVEIDRLKRIEHAAADLIIELDKQSHDHYHALEPLRKALIQKINFPLMSEG